MQQGRKERAWGTRVGREVGGEETGAGQLIGDSKQKHGISEEGAKGAEENKKVMIRLQKELGHGKKKIAKMLSAEQNGWEWQRRAEVTKVKYQKSETEGTGGGGKVPEQKAADEKRGE